MAHWNHRAMVKETEHGETFVTIREVFYEESGALSWTEEAIAPCGETVDELRAELERMLQALDKPVLDEDQLSLEYATKA